MLIFLWGSAWLQGTLGAPAVAGLQANHRRKPCRPIRQDRKHRRDWSDLRCDRITKLQSRLRMNAMNRAGAEASGPIGAAAKDAIRYAGMRTELCCEPAKAEDRIQRCAAADSEA